MEDSKRTRGASGEGSAGNEDDAREDVRCLQGSPAEMTRPEEDDAAAGRGVGGGGSLGISDVSVEPSRRGGARGISETGGITSSAREGGSADLDAPDDEEGEYSLAQTHDDRHLDRTRTTTTCACAAASARVARRRRRFESTETVRNRRILNGVRRFDA